MVIINYLLLTTIITAYTYILTPDGDYIGKFGTELRLRAIDNYKGELYNPSGVSVDLCGTIFVTDTGNHCVSMYSKDGTFMRCFWFTGLVIDHFEPYGIAVSPNNNIYVSDYGNKRIQIFSNWLLLSFHYKRNLLKL